MSYFDFSGVPQDSSADSSRVRFDVKLTLILDGNTGIRRYDVTADDAWSHYNDAYDHAASSCESPDDSDSCYYIAR